METRTSETGTVEGGAVDAGVTQLVDLPGGCVCEILSRLGTARQVARLCLVSTLFRDAALSDPVWEKLLHPCCEDVLANAEPRERRGLYSSKKELYDRLCCPVKLNGGNELFWLDRPTGAMYRALSARALSVVWGGDPRYWSWIDNPGGSRFETVAYLKAVCWLHLSGRFVGYLTPGRYSLSWRVFKLTRQASGWERKPVTFNLATADGQAVVSTRYLDGKVAPSTAKSTLPNSATVTEDECGWLEYVAGHFTAYSEPVDLSFSLTEIEDLSWKGGFCFDGVVIRPSPP